MVRHGLGGEKAGRPVDRRDSRSNRKPLGRAAAFLLALLLALSTVSLAGCGGDGGNAENNEGQPVDEQVIEQEIEPVPSEEPVLAVPPADLEEPAEPEPVPPEMDASGFVLLSEACPEIDQEIRYASDHNFVGTRIDGYEQPVALVTREAAEALKVASGIAEGHGLRLKVYDAYRPQRAVDHFVRWAQDPYDATMKDEFYPDLDKSSLFPMGYISETSRHTHGSTVDITLVDAATGEELDMGGHFDFFGELSHPGYGGVTESQHANRMLLRDIMTEAGFDPISTEWWHFDLADDPHPDMSFDFPVSAESVAR